MVSIHDFKGFGNLELKPGELGSYSVATTCRGYTTKPNVGVFAPPRPTWREGSKPEVLSGLGGPGADLGI